MSIHTLETFKAHSRDQFRVLSATSAVWMDPPERDVGRTTRDWKFLTSLSMRRNCKLIRGYQDFVIYFGIYVHSMFRKVASECSQVCSGTLETNLLVFWTQGGQ